MIEYLQQNWLEFIGLLLGLIYIAQEYKGTHWMWLTGFLMAAINLVVYILKDLFGLGAIQGYQVLISIYGFWAWKFGRKKIIVDNKKGETTKRTERLVTHMPIEAWVHACFAIVAITVVLGVFSDYILNSRVPWCDAVLTAFNIVAVMILTRKYLEQWFFWITYDVIFIIVSLVWTHMYFYAVLALCYIVAGIFGYFNWKRMMKEAEESENGISLT